MIEQCPVSTIIIAKNEASMIESCIKTLQWCKEIVVIDNGSTDETAKRAEALGAKVISIKHSSFARLRNEGLKRAKYDWVLYIDADERVTPTLAKEICVSVETHAADVFALPRSNYFYATLFTHGGWETDILERLFYKKTLDEWTGDIHESPQYSGSKAQLHTPLIHVSHRSTQDGLLKSADWTLREARLLAQSNIAPVTPITVFRKAGMEFLRRAFFKKGYKDGMAGVMEAIIQGINRALVYIQVWELQQQPPLSSRYQDIEESIREAWNSES